MKAITLPKQIAKINYPGKKTIKQLGLLKAFWDLISDPTNTDKVFKLSDALVAQVGQAKPEDIKAYFESRDYYRQMLQQRYLAPDYKVEDLAHYAPGTLGNAYYVHMTSNGFQPNFYPPIEVVDELSYVRLRSLQTHDIWHAVTGYGTDSVGEIGLQAFYLGQTDEDGFAMTLISAGSLYSVLHERQIMGTMAKAIGEGYVLGKAAKNIYPVNWEEMWDRPLADIKAEMNIGTPTAPYFHAPKVVPVALEEKTLVFA